jgi:hypothetical protein
VVDLGGNDHPRVGGGQGVDHAGALGAHGPNQMAVCLHPAVRTDHVQTTWCLAERFSQLRLQAQPVVVAALHGQQRRPHEHLIGGQGRCRVPWKAEQWGAGNGAEYERLGWPQRHPPGVELAMAAKHLLEMVVSPNRGAAHGDQGVAVLGGIQQGAGDGVGAASSAAASCCDRGGRTMKGMMAATSMIPEITYSALL